MRKTSRALSCVWLVAVGVGLSVALSAASQQTPERRSLDFLTVPASQLPAGCMVAAPEPVPTVDPSADVSTDPATGEISVAAEAPRVVATGFGAFPNISWSGVANPWIGTDRRRVSAIHASTSGGADGAKDIQFLSGKEAVAHQNRWSDGVVDGYRAQYSFDGSLITVLALRFENETLAQQDVPVTVAPLRPSRPGSARIEIGPVVVRVQSPDDNACATAIHEHLSGLIQSRDNRGASTRTRR